MEVQPPPHSNGKHPESPPQQQESNEAVKGKRTQIACDLCTSRHVKCDGNSPCLRCVQSNRACTYTRKRKRGAPKDQKGNELFFPHPDITDEDTQQRVIKECVAAFRYHVQPLYSMPVQEPEDYPYALDDLERRFMLLAMAANGCLIGDGFADDACRCCLLLQTLSGAVSGGRGSILIHEVCTDAPLSLTHAVSCWPPRPYEVTHLNGL